MTQLARLGQRWALVLGRRFLRAEGWISNRSLPKLSRGFFPWPQVAVIACVIGFIAFMIRRSDRKNDKDKK